MNATHFSFGSGAPLLLGVLLVLVLVAALSGHRRGRRIGMVVGVAALCSLAAVTLMRYRVDRIAADRQPVPPVQPMPTVAPVSPVPPTPFVSPFPPLPPTSLPGVPLPPTVVVAGDQIVIAGLPIRADLAEQLESDDEAEAQTAKETALANNKIRVTNRLAQYFDNLVRESAPAEQELRSLREKLQEISIDQRRLVAEQAAQLSETIVEQVRSATTQSASARWGQRTIDVSIDPERIQELAVTASSRIPAMPRIATWETIVGTIAVLILAAVILKAATRRHSGVRHF